MIPIRTDSIVGRKRAVARALMMLLVIAGNALAAQPVMAQEPIDSKLPQRQTFVPVADLDVVLTGDREGVLLSRNEFQELYSKALANEVTSPRLPARIVISEADYTAEIAGDHLVVKAAIRLHQFESGWQQLRLPFGQLSIEKATVNGKPAKLGRTQVPAKGKGQPVSILTLLHNQTGDATLELELSALLHASGNDRSAAFQLIPIPSATMKVTTPVGRHLVVGAQSLERPSPIDQPAVYSVPVGGVTSLRLFFNDHQGEQRADSLAFASTGYGLHVSPGEVTWQAKTSLQVFGTTYNQIFCAIPSSLEITHVESTGLESWELSDNPDGTSSTVITLNYRQAFDGGRDMIFRGVMATESGKPWAVPNLTLRNVTSHIGRVTVQHPAAVRVRLAESDGARAATGTVGEQTFDVWREDFNLAFETRTRERELHATVTSLLDLAPTGVTFSAATQVESHFAPLFDVTFRLPAEWRVELIEVDGGSLPWQVSSREAGWNSYRIALSQPLPPGQELSFRFMSVQDLEDWPVEENVADFTLPTVQIPEASIVEGTFVIRAGDDLDLKTVDLFNLDPAPSVAANERLRFFFQQADYEGQLTASRKPSLVSAQSLTFSRLDREVLQSHLQATLDISGGGLRTLQVGLSESAGENLQFHLAGATTRIVEQLPGDVAEGVRLWTLNLDQRVTGQVTLSVDATTPRNESTEYAAHVITVPAAERMSGYIAVEGASDQQLQVTTASTDGISLETVDPIDVPGPAMYAPRERVVGAYRFNVPGYAVSISEARFDRVAVPTAVCYESRIQSVIGRTGELQHRAEFQFVAVGAQSLRLRLPKLDGDTRSELWSTMIDGQPIEVRSIGGVFMIPIPVGGQPDQRHSLVLFYRTFGPSLELAGTIKQEPPQVSVIHGEGAEQRLETLQQSWTLHYPNGTLLTSSTGDFTPSRPLDSTSLLGSLREQFTQIDRSSLARNGAIAAALLFIVGAIAFSLRRLGVGLVGCAGASIAGIVILAWLSTTFLAESPRYGTPGIALSESAAVTSELGFNELYDGAEGEELAKAGSGFNRDADIVDGRIHEYFDSGGMNGPPTVSNDEQSMPARPSEPAPAAATTASAPQMPERQMALPNAPVTENRVSRESESDSFGRLFTQNRPESDRREYVYRQPGEASQAAPETGRPQRAAQPGRGDQLLAGAGLIDAERGDRRFSNRGLAMSGLLSLSMKLQVPQDSHVVEFSYSGNRTAESGVGLNVAWQDRDAIDLGRAFLMIAVALFFWLMISLSARTKAILAVLGISVPLSLISVAPSGLHAILDGVFLGSVSAAVLWVLRAVFQCLSFRQLVRRFSECVGRRKGAGAALLLLALAGSSSLAQAAEPVTPPVPPQPPVTNTVIVPYEPGADIDAAERVLLSREQFIELWNLANPDQKVEAAAPDAGLVDAAFYECRLNKVDERNASVQVSAMLILHSFRDGQIALPVPLSSIALSGALLDGKPASLVTRSDKSGQHMDVVVDGKGQHTLDLKFDVPAQVDGSVGQFTLPLQSVPSGRVVFRLPGEGLDVRVNGSTSAYRRSTDADGPLIQIPVGSGNPLTVSWRPPEQLGMVAAIVHVETSTAVLIDDAGVSEASRISIKVPQGAVSDLSFDLPGELRVRQIGGPQLAGWELNEDNGERRLRVFFNPAVTTETSLDLQLFLDQKQGDTEQKVDLPVVAPRGVTRDTGVVAILASETFQVRSGQVTGLAQIDVNQNLQLPAVKSSSPTSVRLAWRFSSRPFGLQFIVGRRQPQTEATIQHAIQVSRRKIHMASRMRASLRGAPRPGLTFELPEGLLLLSVDATSLSDWFVSESDGVNPRSLTIEFSEPILGAVEVVLEAQATKFPNDQVVEIATPFPLEISKPTAFAGVWFDDAYAASSGDTYGWEPVDPQRVPADLLQRSSKPLQYAFRSTATEAEVISFDVGRAKSRLVADAVVMTSVADTFLDYSLALNWQISDAAIDQFTFTTPGWLKDRLSFAGSSIREVTNEVDGESVRWTLHLQDAAKNRYFVLATATLPPATKKIETPAVRFLEPLFDEFGDSVGFSPVESQRQYVMLINQSQSQLSSRHDSNIEAVSAVDIPIKVDQSLLVQAAEFLRIRDMTKLPSWNVRRLEQQAGAPASVNVADLTLAIAADGTWRGQAVYTVRNRRRQFLGVRLPAAARLLSLFVKGQPSRPVMTELKGQPVHLIPLPKASDSDMSFQVRLVYSGQFESSLPGGFTFRQSELDIPAPQVVTQNESADFGIPVARTLWRVYLPKGVDFSVLDDSDRTNVNPAGDVENQKAYLKSQLLDCAEMLSIVSSSDYTRRQKMVASNNLKQIGLAMHNYHGGANLGESDAESVELQQQIADIEMRIDENRDQIDGYTNGTSPVSGLTILDADGLVNLGEVNQREQVRFNNYALITSNGGAVVPPPGMTVAPGQTVDGPGPGVMPPMNSAKDPFSGDESFFKDSKALSSYSLQLKGADKPQGKGEAKQSAEKQAERVRSGSRELRRGQSLSNLDGLNSFVDVNNSSQQGGQGQAGGGMGGGVALGRPSGVVNGGEVPVNVVPTDAPFGIRDGREFQIAQSQQVQSQTMNGDRFGVSVQMFDVEVGPQWTKVGGLSLPIDIPVTEDSLSFSRVGGEPKLALRIRSRELIDTGVGFVWTLVWLGIAGTLIMAFSRASSARELWQSAVWILFLGGLVSFLVLPSVLSGLGFLAFVLGLLSLAARFVRSGGAA